MRNILWDYEKSRYRGWIGGAVWWYWPVIWLWEYPRNWIVIWWKFDSPWRTK